MRRCQDEGGSVCSDVGRLGRVRLLVRRMMIAWLVLVSNRGIFLCTEINDWLLKTLCIGCAVRYAMCCVVMGVFRVARARHI